MNQELKKRLLEQIKKAKKANHETQLTLESILIEIEQQSNGALIEMVDSSLDYALDLTIGIWQEINKTERLIKE